MNELLEKHVLCTQSKAKAATLGLSTFLKVEKAGHGTRSTYRIIKHKWETLPEGRRNCRGGLPSKESVRRAATAHLGAFAACGSATGYAFYLATDSTLRDYVRSRDAAMSVDLGDASVLEDTDALATALASQPKKKPQILLTPHEEVEKRRWRDVCLFSGTLPDWGPRNERASASKCGHRIYVNGPTATVECSPPDAPQTGERAIAIAIAESDAKQGITGTKPGSAKTVLPCLLSCAKEGREVILSRPPGWLRGGGSRAMRATTAEDLPKKTGLGWIFATKMANAHLIWLPSAVRNPLDPLQLLHDVVMPYLSSMETPEREKRRLNLTAHEDNSGDESELDLPDPPSRFVLMHAGGGGAGNALEKPSKHGSGASSAFPDDVLSHAKSILAPFALKPPIAMSELPKRVRLEDAIIGTDVPYGAEGWGRGALRLRDKGLMGLADLCTFVRRYENHDLNWRVKCPRAVVCLEPSPPLAPLSKALAALEAHYGVPRGVTLPRCDALKRARDEEEERKKRHAADGESDSGDNNGTDNTSESNADSGADFDDDDAEDSQVEPASSQDGERRRRRSLLDEDCVDDTIRVVLASHDASILPSISAFRDAIAAEQKNGRMIEVDEVDSADFGLETAMQMAGKIDVLIASTGSAVGTLAPFLPDGAVVVAVGPPMGAASLGGGISRSSMKRRKRRRDVQRAIIPRRGGLRYIEWNPPPLEDALKVLQSASKAKHSGGWASNPHDRNKQKSEKNLVGKILGSSHGGTSQSEVDDDTASSKSTRTEDDAIAASSEAEDGATDPIDEVDVDSPDATDEEDNDVKEESALPDIDGNLDNEREENEEDASVERRRRMQSARKRRANAELMERDFGASSSPSSHDADGKEVDADADADADGESENNDQQDSELTFEAADEESSSSDVEEVDTSEGVDTSIEDDSGSASTPASDGGEDRSDISAPDDESTPFRYSSEKSRSTMEREWVFSVVRLSMDLVGMGVGDATPGATDLQERSYLRR